MDELEISRQKSVVKKRKSTAREYAEALITALLVAFVIRSFVIEAFKIPSGSMIPTLVIGDHIFVNKFTYGLRIPLTKKRIVTFRQPERGEPIVFIYPVDESKDFIKRVIGIPGDTVKIQGDAVYVNEVLIPRDVIEIMPDDRGKPTKLQILSEAVAMEMKAKALPVFPEWDRFDYYVERGGENSYLVQFDERLSYYDREFEIPKDHLFVMGDNRDNSADSREWGLVPMENVKGKAMFVWLSLDYEKKRIRWRRFGKWIY